MSALAGFVVGAVLGGFAACMRRTGAKGCDWCGSFMCYDARLRRGCGRPVRGRVEEWGEDRVHETGEKPEREEN